MSKYLTIRIINYMTELTLTCGITLFSIKSLYIAPSLLYIVLRFISICCTHQLNIDKIICEREIGTIHFVPIISIWNCVQCFILIVIQYTSILIAILLCTCIYMPLTRYGAKPQCIYISFGIVILIIMIYVYKMLSYTCMHIFKNLLIVKLQLTHISFIYMICKHVCNIIKNACVCKIRGVGILCALYIGIPNTILLRYPNITIRLTQNISQNDSISENSGSSLYNKIHIETEIEKYTVYTGTIIYTYHPGYS